MSFFVDLFNAVFTYPLFNLLMMLYFWLGDFGLSIAVLTAIVSLFLLPLTLRQFRTAMVMKKLQPQVTAIRQQYAKDLTAQTQAMRALHREHGIHPNASFLALLVQAPIYSGLYFALNIVLHASSVNEINGIMYPFLSHFTALPNINLMWFTLLNLSWHISLGIPDPTHLLPVLTGILTLVQMRMTQPNSLVETKDALMHFSQSMQFLLLLIPVGITIVIAWQFAAGLALYRFVSLALNLLVRYFITRGETLVALPVSGHMSSPLSSIHKRLIQTTPSATSRAKRRRRSGSLRHRGKNSSRGK